MSSRVLRRLREEKEAALAAAGGEHDESSEEEDDDSVAAGGGGNTAFLMMLEEGSSSEEESSSESEDEAEAGGDDGGDSPQAAAPTIAAKSKKGKAAAKAPAKEEEDLDAILSDMNIQQGAAAAAAASEPPPPSSVRSLLLSKTRGFDVQDLDLDYAMRSLLGGVGGAAAGGDVGVDDIVGGGGAPPPRRPPRGRRTLAKRYLFGRPREDWGKPPSYVGGGLGTRELTAAAREEERHAWAVPWPYAAAEGAVPATIPPAAQRWFTLTMADTYQEMNRVYEEMLSSRTGQLHDPNSLAMFVADNPFFAETLLQLAMVLYHVNERTRGHELLRRCLFLYEAALPPGALPGGDDGRGGEVLIDAHRPPNANLFTALFRIMQTSGMTGCHAHALATGRFLLSLDPLRDPMGALVILDYYALASRRTSAALEGHAGGDVEVGAAFVVDLVESRRIEVHFKDPLTDRHHRCGLADMPNWSYSYALALYRLSRMNEEGGAGSGAAEGQRYGDRAEAALVRALSQFPLVLPKLLAMNKVNTRDRAFRRDWPAVLPHFGGDATDADGAHEAVEDRVARASGEHLVGIFVRRCHKLWKEEDVLGLLYRCAARVAGQRRSRAPAAEDKGAGEDAAGASPAAEAGDGADAAPSPLTAAFSPALARYAQSDPSEYEDAFRTIPPEAIALDPNIIGPAMALGPNNRGRFLRRGRQQQPQHRDLDGHDPLEIVRQMMGQDDVLDPDTPLMQLYLQSMLPWAQVEGVRPPPRD